MANEKNLENGKATRFSSTNQPSKRGRKPSILKKWIKEYDIPLRDVQAVMTNLMFAYTLSEIKEIAEKEEGLPVGISVMVKGLAADIQNGGIKTFDKMLDRSFGKTAPVKHGVETHGISDEAKRRIALIFQEETVRDCMPKTVRRTGTVQDNDDDR